jgi:hypothetical protein
VYYNYNSKNKKPPERYQPTDGTKQKNNLKGCPYYNTGKGAKQ